MIKCPECGHDVSDKAPLCPHCGVEIAGKVGTSEQATNASRADNQAKMQSPNSANGGGKNSQISSENGYNGGKNGRNGGDTSNRSGGKSSRGGGRNNKSWIAITVLIIAVIAACGVGFYLYDRSNKADKELAEYNFAITSNDTTVLNHYLSTYQDAPIEHIDNIRQRVIELQRTDKAWTNAVVMGTKSALKKYLEENPNSTHRDEALHKIDSIDWVLAKEKNSITSYESYMSERPDGEYYDEASEALRQLNTNTVQPEEEMFIDKLFKRFYQSINQRDEVALTETVGNVLTSFLGKSNATSADVLTFMHKIYKEDMTLMNWHISSSYNIKKKEIGDQQYEYSVEFSTAQDIEYTDKTPSKNNYRVKAKVSPEGKIIEYSMTKLIEQ